ncbi:MAG: right-handed parallel beta-helix repeat-containing protein [Candidatus Eisenbacteria sp.]|nr:right-handed parallel beta-helix repeat-containing protein [Candidatus Eisenbacteria bacterium]
MARKLLAVSLLLAASWAAHADTYVVDAEGTGDFPTIQAAIDSSAHGDLILLGDGTFLGDGNRDLLYHGKAITLQSENGLPEACILDCQGSEGDPHRGVAFVSDETRESLLRGITIMNAWVGGWDFPEGSGGAVLCEWSSPTIENCVFLNNSARSGGGMTSFYWSSPAIIDCTFEGNDAYYGGGGGGLFIDSSVRPLVIRCVFKDNMRSGITSQGSDFELRDCEFSGHSRYGIDCGTFYTGSFLIDNCRFFDNLGPALRCLGPGAIISNCSCWNNRGPNGAALLLDFDFFGTITDCLIYGNIAEESGGAVWCGSGTPTFTNCTMSYNKAGSGAGGIDCGSATVTLENTIIAFSTTGEALAGNATLSCCDLYGNAGGDWIGDIAGQYGIDGNISEDPIFCDPWSDDFTLQADSPCAPFSSPNPECDLIGSEPIGCQPPTGVWPPAEAASWGGVKALFREGTD